MKLEVHHIRALKGKRQLTEINVQSVEQAAAAEAAGIDLIVSGHRPEFAARRAAAPDTHFCFGLIYGHVVNADEAKRGAFEALEAGADSIYCAMHFDVIEAMARERIPVVGHLGLVPRHVTWTGYRAIGRNVEEATMSRLKRRAELHRRSLEAEVREILSRAAGPDGDELAAEIRALHERIITRRGGEPLPTDSVRVLTAVRDRT